MLADAGIKALKPKDKLRKVSGRVGMQAATRRSGAIVFRYDYLRETLTLGDGGNAGEHLA